MAQYLYLIYADRALEASMTPEDWGAMMQAHQEFAEKVVAGGGQILSGEALAPASTATTVRGQDTPNTRVTDGPFAETKETLGGYYLIEAESLDAAIAFGRIVPVRDGGVEIRPVVDTSG